MENNFYLKLKIIGKNTQKFMDKKNISYVYLEQKTGIKQKTLEKIVNGDYKSLTITQIFLIAEALSVKPHVLMENV